MSPVAPPPRIFLPWVRQGTVRLLSQEDPLGPGLPNRAALSASLQLNGRNVPASVQLYGPGDVIGLDAGQVLRTEPPDGAQGFRPGHFPAIEFARVDLPWLFIPARAEKQDRLRPWICLVAVRKRPEINLKSYPDKPLPVLENVPVKELPSLDESWAWAHTQVQVLPAMAASVHADDLRSFMAKNPAACLSRLLCATRLEPEAQYYACVVPTFEIGLRAGLGEMIDDGVAATLAPAWDNTGSGTINLPVYYSWAFATGADDTSFHLFEDLFRRLHPLRELPPGVGLRTMDVGTPGYGLPDAPGTLRLLEGALHVRHCPVPGTGASAAAASVADDAPVPYVDALRRRLNAEVTVPGGPAVGQGSIPVVTPPIYGQAYTMQRSLSPGGAVWLQELNLDPRFRVAAGLGTQIVQKRQEELVAAAWEQAGQLRQARQRLRQAQLARGAGNAVMNRSLRPLAPETLLGVTAPVHARILAARGLPAARQTVRDQIEQADQAAFPHARLSPAYRRLARPRGPVSRREAAIARVPPVSPIRSLLPPLIAAAPSGRLPIETQVVVGYATGQAFTKAVGQATGNLFDSYVLAWQMPAYVPRQPLPLDKTREAVLHGLDPNAQVKDRALSEVQVPSQLRNPDDPLEPLPITPEYGQAMVRELMAITPDWLLPGLDQIPPNSIASMDTNPRFIEAFMVGLNHELARELLWRDFPVDLRGTFFRRFWDPPASRDDTSIIPNIAEWKPKAPLGGSIVSNPAGQIVLVLRGELLRRYPEVIIRLVKAEWDANRQYRRIMQNLSSDGDKYPVIRFDQPPDITFLVFDLSEKEARGNPDSNQNQPGWCFVFEHPPVLPFFGVKDLTDPRDVNSLKAKLRGTDPFNAAGIARAVLQEPLRVAIHADSLIPDCG